MGDDYNAGDECCALVRGKSLFPLIRFYKARDTIEDRQRMRVVLIGATRLSLAYYNESSALHLRLSTHGREHGRECTSPSNTDEALVRDWASTVGFDERGFLYLQAVPLPCLQAWFWRTQEARLFSWVLGGAGTDELITGCLPHPLIMSWLMSFYFQVIYDGQHRA